MWLVSIRLDVDVDNASIRMNVDAMLVVPYMLEIRNYYYSDLIPRKL